MFKLVRFTIKANQAGDIFCNGGEVDKLLEEGWEVKHIETHPMINGGWSSNYKDIGIGTPLGAQILLTQLLLYKKDANELTNSKEYKGPKPITDYPTYGQIYGEQNK